jgi:glutaredoxin
MNKLIKFSRVGCAPCVRLENKLLSEDVTFASYDVEDNLEEVAKFGVTAVPTLLLVNENEEVLGRTVGFDNAAIDELIEKL